MNKTAVLLALAALLGAVSAASVVSTSLRQRREGATVDEEPTVTIEKIEGLDSVHDKSTLTDIIQAITDSVSHVTGQAASVTGQIFNSAFGGLGGIFQTIQGLLSGKPVVATTTTSDGGTGSVVFLVHSKPNE
ncbi:uncharacterized protein LOC124165708 [Ischnura elegans]|uniref:uncharacterized protein LOC124165708 n=1 Tax=Ischnura elegans TaxID=197161 RepID=UPI001ED8B94D|nr:uncharacterized protein LOC124165708 [Ischnura elegans]